jgi:hypothetical protein
VNTVEAAARKQFYARVAAALRRAMAAAPPT